MPNSSAARGPRVGRRAVLLLGLMACAAGCNKSGEGPNPPRASVTGKVNLDGQPAPAGTIVFVPLAPGQLQAQGIIRDDGTFAIAESDGPSAGEYKVEIQCARKTGRKVRSLANPDGNGTTDERVPAVPAKYNTATTLKRTITDGNNEFTFDLESK